MLRVVIAAALLASPAIAAAQDTQAESGQPPQRVRSVTLSAGQKCPPSTSTEVVVCSTLDQPYRIPKQFRDDGPIAANNQSWVNRTATMDQVSRVNGGLPNTCSVVGTGGQSGCSLVAGRQWIAERQAQQRAESTVP
jgi:hypothetical protein